MSQETVDAHKAKLGGDSNSEDVAEAEKSRTW